MMQLLYALQPLMKDAAHIMSYEKNNAHFCQVVRLHYVSYKAKAGFVSET